jgi:RimJ/RimL family protein N-acetyltransferase
MPKGSSDALLKADGSRLPFRLETNRLTLRELTLHDTGFILELVNDPDWHRFIGDRGIRTLDAARTYLLEGPMETYRRLGFGFWRVETRADGRPIGMCGLIKRDTLDHVDLGFAFLPAYRGQGFAHEAASACVEYARGRLQLDRIVATTALDNVASGGLLERLGFRFERVIRPMLDRPEVRLYGLALTSARYGS